MEKERMASLINLLNAANVAYYQEAKEIMSNKEYDELYDELLQLEKSTGIVLSNSPTHQVGCEIVSNLPKERHASQMLSLNKTKSFDELRSWLGNKEGVLSWKLDGLTTVLTYENGLLVKGVTRGNGEVGELITQNVKQFLNVPLEIPYRGHLVVRGESIISYSDFKKINSLIPEVNSRYKNPRNLCSGTVRQLDNSIVKERGVKFIAFELVDPVQNSIVSSYEWLQNQGFEVVGYSLCTAGELPQVFENFKNYLLSGEMEIPSDGLVLRYNDFAYGQSLGRTDKYPKHSLAFKWGDEVAVTTLLDIEWKTSRTGLINPVAVFEPVELEGTTVERASLHNVSIVEQLQLGVGDEITVYKANMIIPQVAENLTKSGAYQIPLVCPECGDEAVVKNENGSKNLYCINPECKAKLLARFTHFVSRECMNIEGLSEETLRKMIDKNLIYCLSDLYVLDKDKWKLDTLMLIPGLGRVSVNKIIESIKRSKHVVLNNFINALGIPGIGKKQAKQIAALFGYDFRKYDSAIRHGFDFRVIDGFGDVLQNNIYEWYQDCDLEDYYFLARNMEWELPEHTVVAGTLQNKTFVITGSLNKFGNRKELQDMIEQAGGKVGGSVSAKTDFLINNDSESTSGKNKKAKELGIPVITEDDLINMLSQSVDNKLGKGEEA